MDTGKGRHDFIIARGAGRDQVPERGVPERGRDSFSAVDDRRTRDRKTNRVPFFGHGNSVCRGSVRSNVWRADYFRASGGSVVGDKLDQEIHIALGRVEVAAGGGAEKLQPLDAVLAAEGNDLRAMLFDEIEHGGGRLYSAVVIMHAHQGARPQPHAICAALTGLVSFPSMTQGNEYVALG